MFDLTAGCYTPFEIGLVRALPKLRSVRSDGAPVFITFIVDLFGNFLPVIKCRTGYFLLPAVFILKA